MTTDTLNLPPYPEPKLYPPGTYHDGVLTYSADQLRAYATAAVLAERERCAKLCDEMERQQENDNGAANTGGAAACASAIRGSSPPPKESE